MVNLTIKNAWNLEIRSTFGLTTRLKTAEFQVRVSVTDNEGNSLDNKKTKYVECEVSVPDIYASICKNDLTEKDSVDDIEVGAVRWEKEMVLENAKKDSIIEIVLYRDFGMLKMAHEVGRTSMTLKEALEMNENKGRGIKLMLFDNNGDLVTGGKQKDPTFLRISVDERDLGMKSFLAITKKRQEDNCFLKHLMIVTRGTRGDVQPFMALARGLAEIYNWEITIVTEMNYKKNVKGHSKVDAGAVHFRPSGGDTTARVQAALSQKAINLKITSRQTNVMQKLFLARSEVEFFRSEPAIYYWAKTLKPDYLMFGFTMASLTVHVSEALNIPVIGFLLQPTSIPSPCYPPVIPLKEESYKMLTEEDFIAMHDEFHNLKHIMEGLSLPHLGRQEYNSIGEIRKRRGFETFPNNIWQDLKDKHIPMIIPINKIMFGDRPKDWNENIVLTDCIFLRGDTIPPIAPDAQDFINAAKVEGGKIVVLAFSSMPVTKSQIVSISLKLIKECQARVCVFALVGGQMNDPLHKNIKNEAEQAINDNRLFLAGRAPFGRLFSLVDTIVLHGGLGTTSETLQAQVPAIVTGVLLLDQRFWGARCSELGVGPFGTHIDDFPAVCVEYVDKALADNSEWQNNVEQLGEKMKQEALIDPSGVSRNAQCVVEMSTKAIPYCYEGKKKPSTKNSLKKLFSYVKGEIIMECRGSSIDIMN